LEWIQQILSPPHCRNLRETNKLKNDETTSTYQSCTDLIKIILHCNVSFEMICQQGFLQASNTKQHQESCLQGLITTPCLSVASCHNQFPKRAQLDKSKFLTPKPPERIEVQIFNQLTRRHLNSSSTPPHQKSH
jgi:hypothetical protein